MEDKYGKEELAKILNEKGFSGYFLTAGGYPGKLLDSLTQYFSDTKEKDVRKEIGLATYIKWDGEQKPYVHCYFRLRTEEDKSCINKMHISHYDCYGKVIKDVTLENLTVKTIPTASEALQLVDAHGRKKEISIKRKFR